ncbi:hypothetical protein [Corynebacterium sp. 13CS0277]|uniref:hypothetical protein n=1 Tax=Corynebacterium sp. 13CS0277 TaxID=2071994 RepID=UPI001304F0B8|nr:hypothetical protein [Corynebacterium sp. 13CS0277]
MLTVYAGVEDVRPLLEGVEPPPTDVVLARALAFVSARLRVVTRAAVYPTTPEGLPAGGFEDVFRHAAALWVSVLVRAGVVDRLADGGAGASPVVTQSSIDGASVTVDVSAGQEALGLLLAGGVPVEVEAVLDAAGLLGGALPWIAY